MSPTLFDWRCSAPMTVRTCRLTVAGMASSAIYPARAQRGKGQSMIGVAASRGWCGKSPLKATTWLSFLYESQGGNKLLHGVLNQHVLIYPCCILARESSKHVGTPAIEHDVFDDKELKQKGGCASKLGPTSGGRSAPSYFMGHFGAGGSWVGGTWAGLDGSLNYPPLHP
eukprot:1159464-Pelagomonas_calceolata.AAC.3